MSARKRAADDSDGSISGSFSKRVRYDDTDEMIVISSESDDTEDDALNETAYESSSNLSSSDDSELYESAIEYEPTDDSPVKLPRTISELFFYGCGPRIPNYNKNVEYLCAICTGNIEHNELSFTNCNHTFHSDCLLKWLDKSNSCPVCRTVVEYMKDKILGDGEYRKYNVRWL